MISSRIALMPVTGQPWRFSGWMTTLSRWLPRGDWSKIRSTVQTVDGGQKADWADASANPARAPITRVVLSDARRSRYSGPP